MNRAMWPTEPSGPSGRSIALWLVVAFIVGSLTWYGVSTYAPAKGNATAPGVVDLSSCPIDGARTIGQLAAGDTVWLIGVTDGRWGVIRHPDDPARPAWVPLALLDTSATARDLPQLDCEVDPTTVTTPPPSTTPVTTVVGATTIPGLPTTTSTSTTIVNTTIATDTFPPSVTVSADRPYLYVTPAPACAEETTIEVSITVADPTLPLSIRSITADWSTAGGSHTTGLVPVAGNRFQLTVSTNGPATGEVPVVITATATDGAGNVGTGTVTVSLRAAGSFGCG